jgi:hypothetical protein
MKKIKWLSASEASGVQRPANHPPTLITRKIIDLSRNQRRRMVGQALDPDADYNFMGII